MLKHLPSSFAWMAAFFAALGTLFFVLGAHTFYRNWQFSGDVERVTGRVTDRYISISHGRHGSSTTYHIGYRYTDAEGAKFVTNVSVNSNTYDSLRRHGAIPVKYLPQFHGINRIDLPDEDRSYRNQALFFMGLGGLFGGFGWYVFIGLERLIFYRRWLRKNGIRCAGRIERIEDSSVTVNKRNVRYLVYSYTDASGTNHKDSSEGLSSVQDSAWNEGDPIEVFCDPRDSSKSAAMLTKS